MWDYTRLGRIMNPKKYLYVTPLATGCTMLFNHKAKLQSLMYKDLALMHDSLLALSVVAFGGEIKAIPQTLIYYRQHGNNVFGTSVYNNSILLRVFKLIKIIKSNHEYFLFVNSLKSVSFFKYIFLKIEVGLKIRNLI
jgi:rhamnosyltransferase